MEPIPLPSYIHYELLLQLLERQTLSASEETPIIKEQVKELIIILRKAIVRQKQIETICDQYRIPTEYRWSINSVNPQKE